MNRTDRLYAIVEELRAVAPRPHSARWLGEHRNLPPVNLTPDEAVALSVGLRMFEDPPFPAASRSAQRKVLASMQGDDTASARSPAGRVYLLAEGHPLPCIPHNITSAQFTGRVLRIPYTDKTGATSKRAIQPVWVSSE